jgi:ABC-type hemin transport system ATPase subunit
VALFGTLFGSGSGQGANHTAIATRSAGSCVAALAAGAPAGSLDLSYRLLGSMQKNAPLLLLDEPTAHLDPATEAEVLDGLRRLALGRTVVLASHAAAAHAFSGRRLDLRDGRVQLGRGVA